MRATRVEREVFRGDTLFFLDQVYQDVTTKEIYTVPATSPLTPPPPNAAPFNLTGCRVWVTAKAQWPDPDTAAIFELDNLALGGVTVTNAASGQFQVSGSPTLLITQADQDIDLVFDIQLKDANGNITTVEYGKLIVRPDVTRATT